MIRTSLSSSLSSADVAAGRKITMNDHGLDSSSSSIDIVVEPTDFGPGIPGHGLSEGHGHNGGGPKYYIPHESGAPPKNNNENDDPIGISMSELMGLADIAEEINITDHSLEVSSKTDGDSASEINGLSAKSIMAATKDNYYGHNGNGASSVSVATATAAQEHGGEKVSTTTTSTIIDRTKHEENQQGLSSHPQNPTTEMPLPDTDTDRPAVFKLKFNYTPLDFERDYYDKLFHHTQDNYNSPEDNTTNTTNATNINTANINTNNNNTILSPKKAAELFLSSGIPSDRLRMIWNMAVMPVNPYPPGMKPPPAMTKGQFHAAVRLIQLFQNRVTAKDEQLRVSKGVMMAPAYFAGVSGVVVPLPWKDNSTSNLQEHDNGNGNTKPKSKHTSRRSTMSIIDLDSSNSSRKVPTFDPNIRKMRQSTSSGLRSSKNSRDSNSNLSSSTTSREEKKVSMSPKVEFDEPASMIEYDAEDEYSMSDNEFTTYRNTFSRHCVTEANGVSPNTTQHVYVDEAVNLFQKSGLHRETLGQLWDVVVDDPDSGKLDEQEFVLMTHLIVCVTRRGLGVPAVLPSPLRTWRKNRESLSSSIIGSGGLGLNNQDEVEGGQTNEGALNDDDKFVPISVVTPPLDGEKIGAVMEQQASGKGNMSDEPRMKQMETEISSLKEMVDSLRTEVQELKEIVHRGANGAPPMRQQYNSASSDDVINVDTSDAPLKKQYNSTSSDDVTNVNANDATMSGQYNPVPNDDVPNVDVEMYWGQGEQEDEKDDEPLLEYPSSSPGMPKTASHPIPKPTPPSAIRQPSPSLLSSRASASNQLPKRNFRMSQNIPPVHPSSGTRGPRKAHALFKSMPQSRIEHTLPGVPNRGGGLAKSSLPNRNGGVSKSMLPNSRSGGIAKSMINGDNDSMASQMQQVQRKEQFDNLLQTTMERIGSDSGSHAGSGSHASSQNTHRNNDLGASFKPAQLRVRSRAGLNRRGSLTRTGLIESTRHITRRRVSGEAEVYKEHVAPSTAAVDLPPL